MLDRFNMPMTSELDLLDHLLGLGAVDGRLDERCELRAPWTLENARSAQREMPYHAVLSGSAVVEGPGLQPTRLHAGDILMLPSGESHRIVDHADAAEAEAVVRPAGRASKQSKTVTLIESSGEPTVLLCGRFVLGYAAWRLFQSLLPNYVIVRAGEAAGALAGSEARRACSRLNRLLALMKEETDDPQPGYAAVLRHLSAALFGLTLRAAIHGEAAPVGMIALAAHPRLRELAVQIVQAPSQAWTIEEMAQIANMSRSSLIRSFSSIAGLTPAEYVTRVRIAQASRLLKETEQSVAAIGEAVGYASEAAFQRAFKREANLTPAAWRALPSAPVEPPRPPHLVSINLSPG